MSILVNWRIALLGLVSWAVPFLASFLFYGPGGELLAPLALFKSVMVVVFGGVGASLLVVAFRIERATIRSGLAIGFFWLVLNFVLDFAVLLPMSGMRVDHYLADIGLRYALIPIMAVAMGAVAERARKE